MKRLVLIAGFSLFMISCTSSIDELPTSTTSPSSTLLPTPTLTYFPTTTPTVSSTPTPTAQPTAYKPIVISRDNVKDLRIVDVERFERSGIWIQGAVFSPDGRYIMVYGYTTSVYDAQSLKLIGTFESNIGTYYDELAQEEGLFLDWRPVWSPDSTMIGYVDNSGDVNIYGVPDLDLLTSFSISGSRIVQFDWSPDSSQIVSSDLDDNLILWDITTFDQIAILEGHSDAIHKLEWGNHGDQVASATINGELFVWDVTEKALAHKLEGIERRVVSMAWHPDEPKLAASSFSQNYYVFNTVVGQISTSFFVLRPDYNSETMAWSQDGRVIAYFGHETIYVKNAITGDTITEIFGSDGDEVDFSVDAEYVSRSGGGIYDVQAGSAIRFPEDAISNDGISWSPAENVVLLWNQNSVQLLDLDNNKTDFVVRSDFSEIGSISAMRLSPDGGKIALLELGRGIVVLAGPNMYRYPLDLEDWEDEFGWLADSERVAVAVPSDQRIHIWNPMTDDVEILWSEHIYQLITAKHDNLIVAGTYDGRIEVWDADATAYPKVLAEGEWNTIVGLAISPEGEYLAAIDSDGFISLVDVELGKRVTYQYLFPTVKGQPPQVSLEWIPDSKRIVLYKQQWNGETQEVDNEVMIISTDTMDLGCTIKNDYYARDINISPMGDLFVLFNGIFDTESCETLTHIDHGVAAWLPDQTGLISWSGDIAFWSLVGQEIDVGTGSGGSDIDDGHLDEPHCPLINPCGIHVFSDDIGGRVGEDRVYDEATDEIRVPNTLVLKPDYSFLAYLEIGDIQAIFQGTYKIAGARLVLDLPDDLDINPRLSYTFDNALTLIWKDLTDEDLILPYRFSIR